MIPMTALRYQGVHPLRRGRTKNHNNIIPAPLEILHRKTPFGLAYKASRLLRSRTPGLNSGLPCRNIAERNDDTGLNRSESSTIIWYSKERILAIYLHKDSTFIFPFAVEMAAKHLEPFKVRSRALLADLRAIRIKRLQGMRIWDGRVFYA